MNKFLISILLLVSIHTLSNAQILNFNKGILHNDSVEWIGQVNVFFNAIDQEVSVANMGLNIDVIRKFEKHSLMAISKLSFASSNKETLLSDGYAHIRGVLNRNKKLSEEFFGQIQYNAIRGLEDRNLIGIGLRYSLLNKDKYRVLIGFGAMQEWENWIYEEVTTNTNLIKNSSYVSFYGDLNEHFHFNIISYYQAAFSSFFDPRISLETNLNLNITQKLKFTSSFTLYYDHKPVVPINNYVFKLKNGLGYRF